MYQHITGNKKVIGITVIYRAVCSMVGRSQVVRQRILIPPYGGSNPPAPANYFSEIAASGRPFHVAAACTDGGCFRRFVVARSGYVRHNRDMDELKKLIATEVLGSAFRSA